MTEINRLSGVLCPVVTPFKPDLTVDSGRLERHCRWLLSNGVGLAVFGTNSEANSLSVDEKIGLLNSLVENGMPTHRMMPGTGCVALPDSVRLTKAAVEMNCAGVLVLPPFFYQGVSDAGLFRSYAEIIEQVGDSRLKIYLYHIPQLTGIRITPELVEQLLREYPDCIAGLKDSAGDWTYTKHMIESFSSSGFDVFPASEEFLTDAIKIGGRGCISATVNINPGGIVTMWTGQPDKSSDDGRPDAVSIRKIFEKYPMIAALKAAIAHFADDQEWFRVRPPLDQLTNEQTKILIEELMEAGFFVKFHGSKNIA